MNSASRGAIPGRQDAVLYGSQDGCRYSRKTTLNTYFVASEGWWEALRKQLQSGSRITSLRNWWREWESHPPEEVYEAPLFTSVEFPAAQ